MKEHLFDSIDCLEAGESLDRQTLTALIEGRMRSLPDICSAKQRGCGKNITETAFTSED